MAETTGIGWTDATQNFWEGCQKAGPGCDNCYAEARDQRWHGGVHFGAGAQRRRVVDATFRRPLSWNVKRKQWAMHVQATGEKPGGTEPPLWVFAMSLGDFLDPAVPTEWRTEAWAVIRQCDWLRWQIVTKRASILESMLPADWGDGRDYGHVGLIATAVTQREADMSNRHLREAKRLGVRWVGLSIEPQLEHIRLAGFDDCLDWVICGGESGPNARQWDSEWGVSLQAQCEAAGIPFFMKQFGAKPVRNKLDLSRPIGHGSRVAEASIWTLRDKAGADPREWPEQLRVQQMPTVYEPCAPLDRAACYR